jgi:hypothetical protein
MCFPTKALDLLSMMTRFSYSNSQTLSSTRAPYSSKQYLWQFLVLTPGCRFLIIKGMPLKLWTISSGINGVVTTLSVRIDVHTSGDDQEMESESNVCFCAFLDLSWKMASGNQPFVWVLEILFSFLGLMFLVWIVISLEKSLSIYTII